MATSRQIDRRASKPRTRDMRILALGFSRTGTISLKIALEKLGYHPYHGSIAIRSWKDDHWILWEEALRAKFLGDGEPYGREEFDKFLGDYDVLEDVPSILFAEELMEAYPDAKVILTTRSVASWLRSMSNTVLKIFEWKTLPYVASVDRKLFGPLTRSLSIILRHWGNGDPLDGAALQQAYINHYAYVRSVVPSSNLLEFESKQGWEPLCRFLGKDIPNEDYPRTNDSADMVKKFGILYWRALARVSLIPLSGLLVLALAISKGPSVYT
ncbi:unnamed protein product [Periconia digitata]|uniref:NAD dependent epimerase/dehydratase n=1 Tax=Periconia digitata TaxID=1303443 RepID=A0A9W4XS43_9PLEO|nr:unnamed protein product [Periconia digitata]